MTFREKLAKEHPECVNENAVGGCDGCPSDYKYEIKQESCPYNGDCTKCWDREIPKTYEEGLQDAWELARKIWFPTGLGGIKNETVKSIFGCDCFSVADKYTPQEALAKLKAYEEEKEIKVGDVVRLNNSKYTYVVTVIYEERGLTYYCGIAENGRWFAQRDVTKTGRHIDIEIILGQIRGE